MLTEALEDDKPKIIRRKNERHMVVICHSNSWYESISVSIVKYFILLFDPVEIVMLRFLITFNQFHVFAEELAHCLTVIQIVEIFRRVFIIHHYIMVGLLVLGVVPSIQLVAQQIHALHLLCYLVCSILNNLFLLFRLSWFHWNIRNIYFRY